MKDPGSAWWVEAERVWYRLMRVSPRTADVQDRGAALSDLAVPVDPEWARQGRLLNTMTAAGFLTALVLLGVLGIGLQRGYLESGRQAFLTSLFPAGVAVLSVVCFALSKQGWVRVATRLYVWASYAAVLAGAALFNGYRSASWLLAAWPIALAGSLLGPMTGLAFAIGGLAFYAGVAAVQTWGWMTPLLPTSPDSFPFFGLAIGWLMIVVAVGLVTAINGRSLRGALKGVSDVSRALELARRELSEQVEARTMELATRAEQFRAVAELGQTAASIQDPVVLLERAATLIAERLGYDHVGIFLLDRSREWAVLRAASSEGGRQLLARGHRIPVGGGTIGTGSGRVGPGGDGAHGDDWGTDSGGIIGYVAEMGAARIASDVDPESAWGGNPELLETRSEIALPLIIAEQVIGVLDIQSSEAAAFGDADTEMLRVLADGMAVAIENARLMQETHETMAQLARYQERDAVRVWRQALARRQMRVAYAYELGEVEALRIADGVAASQSALAGQDPGTGAIGHNEESTATPNLQALTDGALATVGHGDWGSLTGVTRQTAEDGRHLLLAPVSVGGRRLGMLSFERQGPWSDEAVQLVGAVVNQLDLALNNARLLEETRLRASQEAARSEIVSRIRALTSTDAILRNAAEELGRALQVERSRIQLLQFGDQGQGPAKLGGGR